MTIPTITPDERGILLAVACSLTQIELTRSRIDLSAQRVARAMAGTQPGDVYNERVDD